MPIVDPFDSHTTNTGIIDPFDVPKSAQLKIKDPFDTTQKPSFLKSALKAPLAGVGDAVEMYSRALRTTDPEGGWDVVRNVATKGVDLGKSIAEKFPTENEDFGLVKRGVVGGIRSSVPSVAAGVPGAIIGTLGGIPGIVGGYAGSGAIITGAAEYDRFLELADQYGIPKEIARSGAIKSALVEGGIEGAANALDAILLKAGSPVVSGFKQFAKNALKIGGVESGTEAIQAALEAKIARDVGIPAPHPLEAAKESVIPALTMGGIIGAGGTYANKMLSKPPQIQQTGKQAIIDPFDNQVKPPQIQQTEKQEVVLPPSEKPLIPSAQEPIKQPKGLTPLPQTEIPITRPPRDLLAAQQPLPKPENVEMSGLPAQKEPQLIKLDANFFNKFKGKNNSEIISGILNEYNIPKAKDIGVMSLEDLFKEKERIAQLSNMPFRDSGLKITAQAMGGDLRKTDFIDLHLSKQINNITNYIEGRLENESVKRYGYVDLKKLKEEAQQPLPKPENVEIVKPQPKGFTPIETAPVVSKESWQMTKEKFVDNEIEDFKKQRGLNLRNDQIMLVYDAHYDMVKQALSKGKPVPPEVLKDYPELQQTHIMPSGEVMPGAEHNAELQPAPPAQKYEIDLSTKRNVKPSPASRGGVHYKVFSISSDGVKSFYGWLTRKEYSELQPAPLKGEIVKEPTMGESFTSDEAMINSYGEKELKAIVEGDYRPKLKELAQKRLGEIAQPKGRKFRAIGLDEAMEGTYENKPIHGNGNIILFTPLKIKPKSYRLSPTGDRIPIPERLNDLIDKKTSHYNVDDIVFIVQKADEAEGVSNIPLPHLKEDMAFAELYAGDKHTFISQKYYNYIKTHFPDATFKIADAEKAVQIYSNKKLVGLVMPLNLPTRTPTKNFTQQPKAGQLTPEQLQQQTSDINIGREGMPSIKSEAEIRYAPGTGINLETLDLPPDIKHTIYKLTQQYQPQFEDIRNRKTWEEINKEAEGLGFDANQLLERQKGEAYNAAKLKATKDIQNNTALEAKRIADEAVRLALDTKLTTEQQAEVLAIANMKMKKAAAILAQAGGAYSEAGRALNILRQVTSATKAQKNWNAILDALGGREMTLEMFKRISGMDTADTPQVAKFIREVQKARTADMVLEAWRNAILSGTKTLVTNPLSNAITFAANPIETGIAAVLEKGRSVITGKKPQVYFREIPAEIVGAIDGIWNGARVFLNTMKTEIPTFGETKIETAIMQTNIPGKLGRVIRTPQTILMAQDDAMKAVIYDSTMKTLATRFAIRKGLKGKKEIVDFVGNLLTNPQGKNKRLFDLFDKRARAEADYRTYNKALGKIGQILMRLREQEFPKGSGIKPLYYVMPFMRTPTNIVKYGLERTPVNFARLGYKYYKGEIPSAQLSEEFAKPIVGTIMFLWGWLMYEYGYMTGDAPKDKNDRATWYNAGKKPYSFYIPWLNRYISYQRIEPLGSIFGMVADFFENIDRGVANTKEAFTKILLSITRNWTNKTFIMGATNAINAYTDPERYGDRFVDGLTSSLVPNIISSFNPDPYYREKQTFLDSIKAKIPRLSEALPPKRDILGEPAKRGESRGMALFNQILPFGVVKPSDDPVRKELLRLNDSISFSVGMPNKYFRRGKEKIDISADVYDAYSKESGELAYKLVNRIVKSKGYGKMDDENKASLIRKQFDVARDSVRPKYIRQLKAESSNR